MRSSTNKSAAARQPLDLLCPVEHHGEVSDAAASGGLIGSRDDNEAAVVGKDVEVRLERPFEDSLGPAEAQAVGIVLDRYLPDAILRLVVESVASLGPDCIEAAALDRYLLLCPGPGKGRT